MLLRNSISSTKRFISKTLGNLKNLFSAGSYQKLPKSPAIYNAYSSSMSTSTTAHVSDMNIYDTSSHKDFTDQWDSKRQSNNKRLVISSPGQEDHKVVRRRDHEACDLNNNKVMPKRVAESRTMVSKELKELKRVCLVAEKLKELEMLDISNVDHVLDVQEVFHYYSRLTCPAYLEIVDRFFMEMCTEFFGPASTAGGSKKSRQRTSFRV
ncbi:uncharacterized protein LOC126793172 [Argentina anserina]|uniref:uncharacterized protein LOC126793172 n=1 Tax=Argentina anserina TaxID=57926 RepID=UPI0021766D30|nr:uncharacterized protein LOC126793172 [Potentilla anserina]